VHILINRLEEIKKKGFKMNLSNSTPDVSNAGTATDFSKIRVGVKTLDDAIISLGDYRRINPQLGDKIDPRCN
jgi:hypothetical protein